MNFLAFSKDPPRIRDSAVELPTQARNAKRTASQDTEQCAGWMPEILLCFLSTVTFGEDALSYGSPVRHLYVRSREK